jgi:light-regulated signal transduction histidine kinase (bacteriophytochrome)
MVIVQDKTSQKAFDELKMNNKMIKMHTACVSHDMRAPLNAMTCIVDVVLNTEGISDRIVKLIKPVRYTSKILSV